MGLSLAWSRRLHARSPSRCCFTSLRFLYFGKLISGHFWQWLLCRGSFRAVPARKHILEAVISLPVMAALGWASAVVTLRLGVAIAVVVLADVCRLRSSRRRVVVVVRVWRYPAVTVGECIEGVCRSGPGPQRAKPHPRLLALCHGSQSPGPGETLVVDFC